MSIESIFTLNRWLFEQPDDHPGRRFLQLLADFRADCIGREIPWPGREDEAIDIEWYSISQERVYRYSDFVYAYFSFTPELTEWWEGTSGLSDEESRSIDRIREARELAAECAVAADAEGNQSISGLVERAVEVLEAWENAIRRRVTPGH